MSEIEFWSEVRANDLLLLRIVPARVEIGTQPGMWRGERASVWQAGARCAGRESDGQVC